MASRLYRMVILLILTGVGPFSAFNSYGAESCQELFNQSFPHGDLTENGYGTLKANFNHNANYKVELRDKSDVKNQCSLGTCHLHSWVSQLEHQSILNKHNIKISTHYLSAMHWLQSSLEKLNSGEPSNVGVELGASLLMSQYAIMRYGIIPEQAWKGSKDFQKAPYSNRIEAYVSNILARTKWEIQRTMDPAKKTALLADGEKQIRAVFQDLLGELPLTFSYGGVNFTPSTFMKVYFPEITKPMVQMFVNGSRKAKTKVDTYGSYVVVKTNIDQVEMATRELLDKGMSVHLIYDHNAQFVDVRTGIMSISAFNFPHQGAPLPREQRAYFNIGRSNHAVQIVGYDLNPKTGKVSKWKIKNSWGEASGDAGYFHMYADYFRVYVVGVSFFSDAMIKLPTAEEVDPVQLDLRL